MIIQIASAVGVPGSSLIIVGREIRTMFESSRAMKLAMDVFVRTPYLYCNWYGPDLVPALSISVCCFAASAQILFFDSFLFGNQNCVHVLRSEQDPCRACPNHFDANLAH